ncbi:hypothetical protein AOQ88_01275 [Candidatus Riesia sp. GBBU]|nr:hypothetical protein AOQ88_01275 [Candidatus Riesia sp. GBBU]
MIITVKMIKQLRNLTGAGVMECKKALVISRGNLEIASQIINEKNKEKSTRKFKNSTKYGIVDAELSPDKTFGVLVEIQSETDFVSKNYLVLKFLKKLLKTVISKRSSTSKEVTKFIEDERMKTISKVNENILVNRISVISGEMITKYVHGNRIGVLVSTNHINNKLTRFIAMHIAASKPKYISKKDVQNHVLKEKMEYYSLISKNNSESKENINKIFSKKIEKFFERTCLLEQKFIIKLNKKVKEVLLENKIKVIDFIRFESCENTECKKF